VHGQCRCITSSHQRLDAEVSRSASKSQSTAESLRTAYKGVCKCSLTDFCKGLVQAIANYCI